MNCKQAQGYIHSHLEGQLAPSAALAMGHHLKGCAGCKRRFVALSGVYALIARDRAQYVPSPALAQRVWLRATQGDANRLGSITPVRALALIGAVAAGIALGIALGSLAPLEAVPGLYNGTWEGFAADYFPIDNTFRPYEALATYQ